MRNRDKIAKARGKVVGTYRYTSLAPGEQALAATVVSTVTTDEDLLAMATAHHDVGGRCAVVAIFEGHTLKDLYVTSADDAKSTFGPELVSDALESYDPSDMVCIIIARGNKVAALAAPLIQG